MPTISIIIPCYNYARFLPDAINSLIGGPTCLGDFEPQTFQDFDITIVDDASTDDTEAVAQTFINDRVRYIRNAINLGTAATLNVGIKQATGQYITYLSADDMMETTRLESLYQAANANQRRFIYDDLRIFDGKERTDTWPMADYDFDRTLYKNIIHSGIFYPRQAWTEIGGYAEIMRDGREDWQVNVALGSIGWCGVHIREPLYLYRRAGQNRSLNNAGKDWRMKFLGRMQELYPALYRGERPTMCCGNSNKRAVLKQSASSKTFGASAAAAREAALMQVGAEGMTLLEYQLPKAGHVVYTGPVTRQQYVFSMTRKRGYVDARDAVYFLERIEDRRHAFIAVTDPTPAKNVPTPPLAETKPATPVIAMAQTPTPVIATEELVITQTVAQEAAQVPMKAARKPRKPSA